MTELKLGDDFTLHGERYVIEEDINNTIVVRKLNPPVITAFGWTPGQWFIAGNAITVHHSALRNTDAFIDLQHAYKTKYNRPPFAGGYPLVDNITSMFLAVSGVELPGERKPPF